MTLVELTIYLKEHINANKTKYTSVAPKIADEPGTTPMFKAEFSMNFSDFHDNAKVTTNLSSASFDRYAVFREILDKEGFEEISTVNDSIETTDLNDEENEEPVKHIKQTETDRYAALRDIIAASGDEKELNVEEQVNNVVNDFLSPKHLKDENDEDLFHSIDNSIFHEKIKDPIILEINDIPTKEEPTPTKSPAPEVTQSVNHLTSGSLSDAISNSSPEIDNKSPEVKKKDVASESWAIFDTPPTIPKQSPKEKPTEGGISPWSSDSKEFTNISPTTEWRNRKDSGGSGSERHSWSKGRSQGGGKEPGWWDTGPKLRDVREKFDDREERERHRRSTDSYDDEYEMDRNYRRGKSWNRGHHSSSSRDVSPWEEEPCRDWNRRRGPPGPPPHIRRDRDSWDEEDDYE